MAVTTTASTVDYTSNGSSTSYSVPFPFLDDDHLRVSKIDPDDNETVLTLGGDYTVTGGDPTGTVTLLAAVTSGWTVRIMRVVTLTQPVEFRAQGSFSPDTWEQGLDRLAMQVQQLNDGTLLASNYIYDHGDQAGGTLHAAVTSSSNGFATPEMLAAVNAALTTDSADEIYYRLTGGTISGHVTIEVSAFNPPLKIETDNSGGSAIAIYNTAYSQTMAILAPNGTLTLGNEFVSNSGHLNYYGRLSAPAHGANAGLKLPVKFGTPTAVTGTSEGDIVWDGTGNHLYVYDGSAFRQIDGASWSAITSKPTTLSGYGITDAASDTELAAINTALDARLDTLEGYDLDTRVTALEGAAPSLQAEARYTWNSGTSLYDVGNRWDPNGILPATATHPAAGEVKVTWATAIASGYRVVFTATGRTVTDDKESVAVPPTIDPAYAIGRFWDLAGAALADVTEFHVQVFY